MLVFPFLLKWFEWKYKLLSLKNNSKVKITVNISKTNQNYLLHYACYANVLITVEDSVPF